MQRNFSPQKMFLGWALDRHRRCAFSEGADFETWKRQTLPQVLATIGEAVPEAAPNAELTGEWTHDGVRKQRWLVDLLPGLSGAFLINYPGDWREGEQRAGLLCWHGHGGLGKGPVMGNDFDEESARLIRLNNYNYGHRMAQEGFITFAVDWMGMGEMREDNKPNWNNQGGGRDWCNLYYLMATMLGTTSIAVNVAIGRAAVDFACTLAGVDKNRLGVMGLSGGGTMTLWSALCDPRLRAAEIMCYSDLWPIFLFRDAVCCGMQVAPGLFSLVDLPDLQGLLAPRPLLVDIGTYDECFGIDGAMACYRKVEQIYRAAGAADKLELDLFAGAHAWGGNKSVAFFKRHLLE